jgi:site-specific DNA-adenine methylase
MVPTFKMHGSKARTAAWISGFIPHKFGRWIEPFAGRGNVLFRIASSGHEFQQALLNDMNTAPFLTALRDQESFEFVDAPPIDKALWMRWRDSEPSPDRALAESYVARFGSSYSMGPNTAGAGSKNGHSRENTIRRMTAAQEILRRTDARITAHDYSVALRALDLREDDVVYMDPPYDVKQTVHYSGIDHDEFLDLASDLPCWVFISGYSTPRYEAFLSTWGRAARPRASVGKGASSTGKTGAKPKVEEILWWKSPGRHT